jgi:competence ComEA-like helix-hairpin-helix protein
MKNLIAHIKSLWASANKQAEQYYSPGEIRALILFLALGACVLVYRGGKQLKDSLFPDQRSPQEKLEQHRQDSIFAYLTAKARTKDSLYFSLPDDSLPSQSKMSHTRMAKEQNLKEHSISLNASSKAQLMKLPTVGEATAEQILQYRAERGKFRSLIEIKNIRGIGEKRYARMKPFLRLD